MPSKAALAFALLMFLTYAGYPGLSFLMACAFRRRVRRRRFTGTVSVVLAVHNEGNRVAQKVANILRQSVPCERIEIIVADDGSEDGSLEALKAPPEVRVTLVRSPARRGKASALNAALERASGEVVVFTDARQRLASGALESLLENFADPRVAAVTGRLSTSGGADAAFRRYVELLRSWESRWGSCAGATGALYAVRRTAVRPIPAETILDDLVLSLGAVRFGRLVYDARAIALEPPQDALTVWKRRLRTLAGNWQILLHPMKFRRVFSARSLVPLFFQKWLRVLFPFFAAGLAVCLLQRVPNGTAWALLAAVCVSPAFLSPLASRKSGFLADMLIAPVEALFLYLLGRQTALWSRPSGA